MKNPNGYGTVVKLSGNRRNPYAARKTKGFNEKGHPVYINIGYAKTREEALILLAQFNKNPWNIETNKITLNELYDLWTEKRLPKLGKSNGQNMRCAWNYLKPLGKIPYNQIKSYQMQDTIDGCGKSYSTQAIIKNLWGHLDRFALELDIISKANSTLLTSDPIPESKKKPFTDEEVQRVWDNQQVPWMDTVLILLYTGFRISEFLTIETANVDLQQGTIIAGVKTAAGKNRIVPIHSKIMPIIQKYYDVNNKYLITNDGKKFGIGTYRIIWEGLMQTLDVRHTPHECRHTFRSRLDSAGANKVCIDLMMGHKSKETGERVYTHKTIQELKENIELITH